MQRQYNMSDKQHIDEYFKHGLRDIEMAPPPDAWENISRRLDKKRRLGVFYIWTSLAAGVALLIGVGIFLRSSGDHNTKATAQAIVQDKKLTGIPKPEVVAKNQTNKKEYSGGFHKEVSVNQPVFQRINNGTVSQTAVTHKDDENIGNSVNQTFKQQADSPVTIDRSTSETVAVVADTAGNAVAQSANLNRDTVPETKGLQPLLAENNPGQSVTPDPDEVPKHYNKWSLSGQLSPLYAYRNASQSQSNEKGLVTYSGGVKVNYSPNKRLSLQTGVFYAVLGQTVDNVHVVTGLNSIPNSVGQVNNKVMYVSAQNSMGSIVSNNTTGSKYYSTGNLGEKMYVGNDITHAGYEQGTAIQKLNYIEVPLLVRYKILDNRQKQFGVHVMGGLGANFLVNNYVMLQINGTSQRLGSTSDLNQLNCSSIVGLGIDYSIFRKIDLTIEPTYKYYLSSISANKNIDFRPYSFGLFTGLIYKF